MNYIDLLKQNESYAVCNLDVPFDLKSNAQNLCFEYNNTHPKDGEKRQEILKNLFGTCNGPVFVEPSFRCDYGFNIHFHGFAFVNYNCVILDTSPVHIGANAFIAPGVCLSCAGHAVLPEQRIEAIGTSAPIIIEDDVWIGANVTVIGGVTIRKGSVIGAGSVVTRDIPSGVIAVGSPCKPLRKITEKDRINPIKL